MTQWREDLLRQGAQELEAVKDLQNIDNIIRLIDGGYWEPGRAPWKSTYYDNILADQRRESLSALSDIKPTLSISSKVPDYEQQAKIAHMVLRHYWINDALDLKLVEWIDHALLCAGFWKIVGYTGRIAITPCALGTVIPVQMKGNDLQSAAAVIYRSYESLMYFFRVFGRERSKGLEKYSVGLQAGMQGSNQYNRPDSIPEYQWNSLSPAMKYRMWKARGAQNTPQRGYPGYSVEPYPVIPLHEIYHEDIAQNDFGHPVLMKHPDLNVDEHNYHYIVEPGGWLFPRKRYTAFGGDDVMYDGPSPFWDGKYPFAMLALNPCVWAPFGISKYRDLIPLVQSANRIGAGVEETVMDAVNRNVVTRKGAIAPTDWDRFDPSRPKQKIMLNGTANPQTDFRYMDAKQLPVYVEMWLRNLDSRIKQKSGALDVSGLSRKKQVPGGDTITGMQDAMSGPYRLESRYVEQALCEAGILGVSRIFQFLTLDDRLRLLGPDGKTWEDYDYQASSMVPAHAPKEDWWRLFPVNVAQGSMHGSSQTKKQIIAMNLAKVNKISLKSLYEILEIGLDADQEIAQIKQEMSEMPQPAPAKSHGRQERMTRSARTGGPF